MQADRRQYARRQQALAVKIVKGNQERSELATNVSATGAFISGVKTPEAGAEIVLVVRPPGERIAPVVLKCEVTHIVKAGGLHSPGYGVRFIEAKSQAGGKDLFWILRKFLRVPYLEPSLFELDGVLSFTFPQAQERFNESDMTTHIAATEMRRSRHDSGVRRKPITDVSGRGRTSSSKIQAVVARPTLPLTSKPINSDNVQSGPAVVAEPVEQAAATVRNTVPAAVINPQTASQSESVAPLRSESVVNQPASKGSLFRPPPVRNRIVSARSEIDTTVEKTPLAPPAPARSPSSQSQRAPAPIALGASDPNQRPDAPPPSRRISAISTVRRPSDIDEQARGLEPRTKEISQIVSPSAKQPSIARRQSGSSGWSTYDNRSNGTSATKRRRSAVVSDDPFATEFKKAAAERMKVDEQKKERRLSKIESATKASRANSNRFFTGEDFSVNADENSMLFATSAALSSVNGNMVTGVDGAGQMLNQLGGASTVNLPVSYVLDDALHSAKLVTLSPMVVELICSFPLPTLEQRFEINLPMEHEGTWMPVHLYGKLLRVPEERGKESSITVHIERVHEPKGFEGSYARFCNQANQQ